jgi:PD-(D/E)XK nuclease superfamily
VRLSASQIQTFSDCQRKWAWRVIEGIEAPSSPSADLGKSVHAELEKYLAGGEIDFTSEVGYIAASGLEHLPKPGTWVANGDIQRWVPTPGLLIEQEFHFEGPSGHTYLGYKDLEAPGVIYDHKTTGDLKWQKTAEDLSKDIQATLYATDYFRNHPDEPDVELRWVYYQTKNTKKSAITKLRVSQTETWQKFLEIEKTAEKMHTASASRALDLPANTNHCNAYGGCPYQGNCNLSPFDKMRSYMEQNKLTNLLKNKTNGTPPAGASVPLAFQPGGAHHGTAAAAAPVGNKLLAKLHAGGAPAAAVVPAAINPPESALPPPVEALKPTGLPTVLPSEQLSLGNHDASGQQLARARPAPSVAAPKPVSLAMNLAGPVAALSATEAGQELAESLQAPQTATRGRGRPAKAALPATGLAVKIKILYLDCGPVGVSVVDASQLIALAKARVATTGIADYRFAEYGQGPGMLCVAAVAELDALEGVLPAVRLDTTTPEGSVIAAELMARAELVVR